MAKTSLANVVKQTTAAAKPASPAKRKAAAKTAANPAHGERGDFLKVTITLSPETFELLTEETTRRRLNKLPDATKSAVLREAVVAFLHK